MAKNERQRLQNLSRGERQQGTVNGAQLQSERKREIDRTLATTRTSTASMGKFDQKLVGEKKLKGVKRKVHFTLVIVLILAHNTPDSLTLLRFLRRQKNHKIWLSCPS